MELIVQNVGCELGILPPRIFAMMVLVALVSTLSVANDPEIAPMTWSRI